MFIPLVIYMNPFVFIKHFIQFIFNNLKCFTFYQCIYFDLILNVFKSNLCYVYFYYVYF